MTSTEHQMDRMHETESGHVEIVETNADQPWHVRYVAGNTEPLAIAENLTSCEAAETNLRAMARLFGAREPQLVRSRTTGRGVVIGGRRAVDVVYVDERDTVQEPPC